MPTDTSLLEELRDIHLPDPDPWWSIATGWYIVLFLGLFFFLLGTLWLIKRYSKKAIIKRNALKKLKYYAKQYEQEPNDAVFCHHISALLRRVALAYFPREKVAGLTGIAWIKFLDNTAKNTHFERLETYLLDRPYQAWKEKGSFSEKECHLLMTSAETWIKRRGKDV